MRAAIGALLLGLLTATMASAADPLQWLPRESWPGGAQADARLDQPVKLWATALPLREVFAQLQSQTGVSLGFDPPTDDNARLCVNIYLNPQNPPTLREVMTQLSWVMDCGLTVTGEGDARHYLLLSAGPPGDLDQLRAAQEKEFWRQQDEAAAQHGKELRAAAVPRLLELRAAFALPRQEAIRRYRGSDDALLLVLLDPARRARAQLITVFSDEQIQRFAVGGALEFSAPDWTPEQRALAEASTGLPAVEQDQYDRRWVAGGSIDVGAWGGINMGWTTRVKARPSRIPASGGPAPEPLFWLSSELHLPGDVIALRRFVGEVVTPDMELEAQKEYEARDHQQLHASGRDAVAAAIAQAPGDLSPTLRQRLEDLVLPLPFKKPHALWEIQEAVSSATGMNVVSDHFSQLPRDLGDRAQWLVPEGLPSPTALLLIQLASAAYEPDGKAWEWGDAGSFLRFRSRRRSEWRAALLPQELLAAIDADLARVIPPPGKSLQIVRFTIELRPYQTLLVGLGRTRLDEGRLVADGRPLDDPLRAAREEVLAGLARSQGELTFLAGFGDRQWAKLQAEGLEAAGDVTLDQLEYLRNRIGEEEEAARHLRELTVRLVPAPDEWVPIEVRAPVQEVKHHFFSLKCLRGEEEVSGGIFVRSVEITLTLAAAPQASADVH